jgi:hypothetical protein
MIFSGTWKRNDWILPATLKMNQLSVEQNWILMWIIFHVSPSSKDGGVSKHWPPWTDYRVFFDGWAVTKNPQQGPVYSCKWSTYFLQVLLQTVLACYATVWILYHTSFTKGSRKEVRLFMFIVRCRMTEIVVLRLKSKCPALKTALLLCSAHILTMFIVMANIMNSRMYFSS